MRHFMACAGGVGPLGTRMRSGCERAVCGLPAVGCAVAPVAGDHGIGAGREPGCGCPRGRERHRHAARSAAAVDAEADRRRS